MTDFATQRIPTDAQVDAAAKALREHDMKGRITRPWTALPKSDAKKWKLKAFVALTAAMAVQ
jgi:hypothetical protein